jgi:hypothetical protein
MGHKDSGKRHPLLLYRRTMDRFILATLPLGVVMAFIQWPGLGLIPPKQQGYDFLLLGATIILLAMALMGMILRNYSYIQAQKDHLKLATPLLSLKVSYRRLKSVHPVPIGKLFPVHQASWSERRFLEPFYGETAVVVELSGYPLSKRFLRFFLGQHTFLPHATGFVFLVPDWMGLSMEIDSLNGKWRHNLGNSVTNPRMRGILGSK